MAVVKKLKAAVAGKSRKKTEARPKVSHPRTFAELVVHEYDQGKNFQQLADDHETTVEKVQAIVEADQALKNPEQDKS